MSRKPIFSIIVPVYNTSSTHLKSCLDSILNQTFGEFELIIVDDGSTNDAASICDLYAHDDPRIKVIYQQHQGVSTARNNGIKAATADWIWFVDSDDWLRPNACEVLDYYLSKTDCDILLFNLVKEYAKRQEFLNYGFLDRCLYQMDDVDTREYLYRRAMQTANAGKERYCTVYFSCDKVFSRDFLINNNLQYPTQIAKSEDKVFILRCFEKMRSLYYVDNVLYHYRIHSNNTCRRYSETSDTDRIELAHLLSEIAERMDRELGVLKGVGDYSILTSDFKRFVFGIISDVLLLKYYHHDYPGSKRSRSIMAEKFIATEPFASALQEVKYSELHLGGKIKKFLLSHKLVSFLVFALKLYRRITGRNSRD